ncbi:recombinase family protein [Rubrobacter aplysinae]|uniref:recombinase family protein n=1 Tax=Rubrobacter aplysinae TaxID=909625 RepID=UPI0009FBAA24|nr:recombinase family protein [Rubrobacter aplysinae]
MDIGYAQVSTGDQSLELQKEALENVGVEERYIYTDVTGGANFERPGLERARDQLREGDTLVVWRLDRLGRSLKDLIETVNELADRGIGFKSLTEAIDTTTSGGRLVFHIFGALAEFEREIIRERTMAGLNTARARGRYGGRPKAMDDKKVRMAKSMLVDQFNTVADVCEALGVSRSTLYKYVGPGGTGPVHWREDSSEESGDKGDST